MRKRHKESGDRLRLTAGLHLPIQSKEAKCDSRRPKTFGLALRRARHSTHKPLIFKHERAHSSKSQKTQNKTFPSRHFAPLCAVALPTPWPIGRCPHRQDDRPLPRPPRSPSLSRRGKQHDFRPKVHSFSSEMHHLSPLPHTRATRHAPSHPHFSRGAFFAFTLHLHTYSSDIQTLTCELYPRFLLHRGEGKGGEAFTLITLLSNDLRERGEEVKAKNEKRRTRPRARKTPKNGALPTGGARHLSCRADHLGEAPSDRKKRPRFAQQSNSLFPFLPCKGQQSVRSALAGTAIFPAPSCKTTKTPQKAGLLPFDFERTDAFLRRNR